LLGERLTDVDLSGSIKAVSDRVGALVASSAGLSDRSWQSAVQAM
jgi:hypothetical protein